MHIPCILVHITAHCPQKYDTPAETLEKKGQPYVSHRLQAVIVGNVGHISYWRLIWAALDILESQGSEYIHYDVVVLHL